MISTPKLPTDPSKAVAIATLLLAGVALLAGAFRLAGLSLALGLAIIGVWRAISPADAAGWFVARTRRLDVFTIAVLCLGVLIFAVLVPAPK